MACSVYIHIVYVKIEKSYAKIEEKNTQMGRITFTTVINFHVESVLHTKYLKIVIQERDRERESEREREWEVENEIEKGIHLNAEGEFISLY